MACYYQHNLWFSIVAVVSLLLSPCSAFLVRKSPLHSNTLLLPFSTSFSKEPLNNIPLLRLSNAADNDATIITTKSPANSLDGLDVVIAGAGPAGLLLAHCLLQNGSNNTTVSIYESRPDPRGGESGDVGGGNNKASSALAGFAYALGLGIRGRTAIRDGVDETLWQAIKLKGNECDRFRLHVGPFNIKLRDSQKQKQKPTTRKRKKSKGRPKEVGDVSSSSSSSSSDPSLLLFQSDLCIALMDELERRYHNNNGKEGQQRLHLNFESPVIECDLSKQQIIVVDRRSRNNEENDETTTTTTTFVDMGKQQQQQRKYHYDLLVGCDGVNSVVRNAMKETANAKKIASAASSSTNNRFEATKQTLPGEFKVARLSSTPPKMDPNSVALIVPKKGSSTAFMEPTVNGSCCILFAGRGSSSSVGNPENNNSTSNSNILASNSGSGSVIGNSGIENSNNNNNNNKTAILAQTLLESFPLLEGADLEDVANQLLTQKAGSASSVQCNVYHYGESVALCGDAAHATGGVSGQGVNSALLDSVALSDCLVKHYDPSNKQSSLKASLLEYSKRQVPEGKALYDLSFGPKPTGIKKMVYSMRGIRDTIFGGRFGIGKPPLQTLLTTSMEPFSSIRRRLDFYYDTPFPDQEWFDARIDSVSCGDDAKTHQ